MLVRHKINQIFFFRPLRIKFQQDNTRSQILELTSLKFFRFIGVLIYKLFSDFAFHESFCIYEHNTRSDC